MINRAMQAKASLVAIIVSLGSWHAAAQTPTPEAILLVDGATVDTYLAAATPAQDIQPLVEQRGVGLDGSLRSRAPFGWAVNANPFAHGWNDHARYRSDIMLHTGRYSPTEIDLSLPAPGFSWTVGRTYSASETGVPSLGHQGYNWQQFSQPEMVYYSNGGAGDRIYLVYGADRFLEFKRLDATSPVYRGINGAAGAVVASEADGHDVLTYWDQHGTRSVFFDPRDANNVVTDGSSNDHDGRGQLWTITDAAGNIAYVGGEADADLAIETGYDDGGRMQVGFDTAGRKYVYSYDLINGTGSSSLLNDIFLVSVEAFVDDGLGGWDTTGAKVEYNYYTDVTSNRGAFGWLRGVTVLLPLPQFDPVNAAGEVETFHTYHAYSTQSGIDDEAVISVVVGPEGHRKFFVDHPFGNIDTVSLSTLADYMSYQFDYYAGYDLSPGATYNDMWNVAIRNAWIHGHEDEVSFKYEMYETFADVMDSGQYDPEHASITTVAVDGWNAASFMLYFDEVGQPLTRSTLAQEYGVYEFVSRGEVGIATGVSGVIEMITSPLASEPGTNPNPSGLSYTAPTELRTDVETPSSPIGYSADGALIHVFPQIDTGVFAGFVSSVSWQSSPAPTEVRHGPHAIEEYDYLSPVYDSAAAVDVGDDYLVVRPLLWKHRTFNNYKYSSSMDPVYSDETTYAYEFHAEAVNGGGVTDPDDPCWLAPRKTRTTYPVVTTTNHGSNIAATSDDYHRADGTPIFRRDETDVLFYTGFVNNLVVKQVDDIRLSGMGQFVGGDTPADYFSPIPVDVGSAEIQNSTTFIRDEVGRVVSQTMPNGRVVTHRYEELSDGQLARVSSRGQSGSDYLGPFDYIIWNDEGMQVVEATVGVATSSASPATWIDDAESDPILASSLGDLASLIVHSYNSAGLIPSDKHLYHAIPVSGAGVLQTNYDTESYLFDAAGDLLRFSAMSGTVRSFVRDSRGHVVERLIASFNPSPILSQNPGPSSNDGDQETDANGDEMGGYCNCVAIGSEGGCLRSTTNVNFYAIQNDIFGRAVFLQRLSAPFYALRYDNLGRITSIAIYSDLLDGLAVNPIREAMNPDVFNEYDPDLHGPDLAETNRVAFISIDYDERGRVVRRSLEKIDQATGAAISGATLTWSYTYDQAGRLIREQGDALTKRSYDRLGREVATYEMSGIDDSAYSDASNVTGDVVERETHRVLDKTTGLVLMETVTERTDNDYGSSEHRGNLDTNSYSTIAATTVNPANLKGRAQITLFEYDDLDRLTVVSRYGTGGTDVSTTFDPDGGSMPHSLTTQYAYDAAGRLAEVTDPLGRVEKRGYDTAGRLISRTENYVDPPTLGANDENRITEWTYLNGQLVEYIAHDDTGTQTTVYGYAASGVTGDKWPTRDLLRKITFPDGGTEEFHYASSNLGKRIDPAGNEIAFEYDLPGRINALNLTAETGFDGTVARIELEYAAIGRLAAVRQLDSNDDEIDSVVIVYDGWSNLAEFTQDPDGTAGAFDPKTLEHLWELADPAGGRQTLRLAGMSLPGGGDVSYSYAAASGSHGGPSMLSRLSSVTYDGTVVAQYDYMGIDTVIETRYPTNVSGYPIYSSLHDGAGNFDALDDFNRPVRSRWNRVRQYSAPASEVPFYDISVIWDDNSNVTGVTDHVFTSFFNYEFTNDGLNRLVESKRGSGSGAGVSLPAIEVETWNLSTVGNWQGHDLERTGSNPPNYSDAGEFRATGIFNIINEMTSLEKDIDNDSVTDITYTRSYNDRGDLTDDGENYTYTYDVLGRLVEIRNRTTNDLLSQYKYNGLGYRTGERIDSDADGVLETGENDWRYFIYDARWRLIEVYEDSDDANPLEVYVHHAAGLDGVGTGSYVDHIILRERDTDADGVLDEFHFYCQNWRADVVVILDEAGRQIEQVRYTPYGVPIAIPFAEQIPDGVLNFFDTTTYQSRYNAIGYEVLADRDLDGDRDFFDFTGYYGDYSMIPAVGRGVLSNSGHRFGYAGYWYVTERGLYHVRNRWYDPSNGSWLRRDPALYINGPSLFQYVVSNPQTLVDPFGLGWFKNIVAGAVSGALGGMVSGAITGGIVGLVTGGPAGLVGGALAGGAAGIVAGAVSGAISAGIGGRHQTPEEAAKSGFIAGALAGIPGGAIGAGAGAGVGAALGALAGATGAGISSDGDPVAICVGAIVGGFAGGAGGAADDIGKGTAGLIGADAEAISALFGAGIKAFKD